MSTRLMLDNILGQPDQKQHGQVVKPLGSGKYQVRDSQGRLIEADSDILWNANAGVTIKDGRIVGTSSQVTTQKTYQV